MRNTIKQYTEEPEILLTKKEKTLEFVATAMCFLLLLACFLKVIFF
jgi:hypothetical protein